MTRTGIVRSLLLVSIAVGGFILLYPREYRAAVQTYQLTNDPRTIVLHVSVGAGDIVVGSDVHEDKRIVTIIVKARDVSRATGGSGDSHFVTVTLRDPLGDRVVIDGTDLPGLAGHVVPRVP